MLRARASAIGALAEEEFDVLVIGGGITGAGVARDCALRGLRTAVVEQDDWGSGTSSRSSRLVHGGVRYLEHGELRLVFESSAERRTLLRIAPHLVRPLPFTWPVYRGARLGRWRLAAGLALYDALSLFRNVGRHERLSARRVAEHEPALGREGLTGGARYWDAGTDDVRLTLATVASAREAGAVAVNHLRVTSLLRDRSRVAGAVAVDTLGGGAGHPVAVRARVTVSAAGPWTDDIERMARSGTTSAVRGSKGVHLAVPRDRVRNAQAVTLLAPQDGRVMFVLPAGDFTIIGTTDTYEDVHPQEVRAGEDDVRYLLEAANHHFPSARLTRGDVVSAWAGLRPLAASDASGADPGSASREHEVAEPVPGLVRVTGGKLTTYRAMAEEITDRVAALLGVGGTPCRTAEMPLYGGDADVSRAVAEATRATGDARIAERLVHAHGSRWRDVWGLAERTPALRERIEPGRPYVLAELRHGVLAEQALTLADLLVRRVPVAFETRDAGRAAARRVAPRVAEWLGWSGSEREAAVAEYDRESRRLFGVDPA